MNNLPKTGTGPSPGAMLKNLKFIRDHPHRYLLEAFQEFGDAVTFRVPGNHAIFINHPDDVQHVLQMNHRNYDKRTFQYRVLSQITGKGLLTHPGGQDWLKKRRIAQPAFNTDSLKNIVPIVVDTIKPMLGRWREISDSGIPLDIDREMMQCALDVVSKALFGADLSDQAYQLTGAVMDALDYLIYQTRTLMMVPDWVPTRQKRDYQKAMKRIEAVVNRLIDRRSLEEPGEDFLGLLLGARDDKGQRMLSRKEVRDEVVTLLIAGHETVASSLTWSWYLLAQHPDQRKKLREEADRVLADRNPTYEDLESLAYTRQVYDEALRLYPPAWLITRRALGEDRLRNDTVVAAGSLIIISPYTMHRRPDLWPEPDAFSPERFGKGQEQHRFGFIPFGGGPRLCIGNRFAYTEAITILAMVSRAFELHLPEDGHTETEALVTLRPKKGLPMLIKPAD